MQKQVMLSVVAAGMVGAITGVSGVVQAQPMPEDKAITEVKAFIQTQKQAGNIDTGSPVWKTSLPEFKPLTFTKGKTYYWNLKTNKGDIKVKFMPDVAPNHVSSTIYLTELGFYDDLMFHRVIPGFMAQGGCPLGRGTGGPGYTYNGEYSARVKHDRPGLLSMANTGRPKSDGSQFFLTFVPTPHLDGRHTIFGEVDEAGLKVLKEMEKFGSGRGQTSEELKIEKATITVE